RKRNQIILDLYEGMKLAADTLEKQGVRISLRAYDTERNITRIKNILSTDELKSTDLIVGPYFQEENDLIQEFSQAQKINVFNPLSGNSDITGVNPFAFLFQPSYETLGRKSAEFLASYKLKKKNCMVFYGTTRRDSLMAANFIQTANAKGLTIVSALKIPKESVGKIIPTLATATEYDEFKYPKQFTLKKDSLGSIYVASDDALIYAKVLSSVEQRGDSILVLGAEDWIEQPVVGLEKFQTLPVVLAAPNAIIQGNKHYAAFFKKFLKEHGRAPDLYARIGYEFMLFAGTQLKKHGVYFQEEMSKQTFIPGFLTSGFNFQLSRDNQLVPFISLKDGKVGLVDKR
ncbi:MAG TPA: ABC transporter substrate-binding protein, partial [Ohtaekwangia sp.]|nr:ABC transporter substrate-binding protein [Ohtaekwangia sp.]